MGSFRATIGLLGINPFVTPPRAELRALFVAAGRQTSPIPITVELGNQRFRQNLVKYAGAWRLYLNGPMREAAGKQVGERVALSLALDPEPRTEPVPVELERALVLHPAAHAAFAALAPSRRKEIARYLNSAKTSATRERNVAKVVAFLLGAAPAGLAVLGASRKPAQPKRAVRAAKAVRTPKAARAPKKPARASRS